MKNIEAPFTKKVYHLSWLAYSSLMFLELVILIADIEGIHSFLRSFQQNSLASNILGTTLLTGLCIFVFYFFWIIYRMRLILASDGITLYIWGCRMYTPWQNLLRIEKVHNDTKVFMLRSFIGIRLRQNYIYGMKIEEGRRRGIAVLETDWWTPINSMHILDYMFPIILYIGGHHWPRKALGRDIQRYAPWLFAQQSW